MPVRPDDSTHWGPPPPSGMGTPPVLQLDAIRAFVTSLFAQVPLFGLLVALTGDALRRLAASALRYSKGVTAAVIQSYGELGEGDRIKDLLRQAQELEVMEQSHQAHEEMYERETTTILARRDAIRAATAPLVAALLERDGQDPKTLEAVNRVKRALADDEEGRKNASKLREEGRSESQPLLAQRESEMNDLRLHLDQRQKQVDFLNNKVAELEARLAGLSAPAAKAPNSRSTPR